MSRVNLKIDCILLNKLFTMTNLVLQKAYIKLLLLNTIRMVAIVRLQMHQIRILSRERFRISKQSIKILHVMQFYKLFRFHLLRINCFEKNKQANLFNDSNYLVPKILCIKNTYIPFIPALLEKKGFDNDRIRPFFADSSNHNFCCSYLFLNLKIHT